MRDPRVFLVGAGPGDPSLISVRGLRHLEAADVVVHDHLVSRRLLRSARADAEVIDVGAAAPQPLEQDAICFLIADKAREGKRVVRLKWGDPFVFDSGGKEALFLHEQGIGFEVVPGVPATIGVPAYAGVPVTYPGAGDTLVLVRGHEGEAQGPPDVDWPSLARVDGTLVCYVGGRQIARVVDGLLAHGRSPEEAAALVYDGTRPNQVTIQGTLAEIARAVTDPAHRRPAVLIVGRAVGLREHLRWFDTRPLFGKRVLVTRARAQAAELVDRLADLGAEPIEAPVIRIAPAADLTALDDACARIASFDWVILTSVNGVDRLIERLMATGGDVRDLKGVAVCAIGPATAERLGRHGLRVDLMPAEHRAEGVIAALQAGGSLEGKRMLLPRADLARDVLPRALIASGAIVEEVTAYRTMPELDRQDDQDIYKMLLERQIDVVTFTSASTVRNFVGSLGADQAVDLLRATTVAVIGPVTADAAAGYGIEPAIMPATYTIPALVDAIVDHVHDAQT